MGEPGTDLFVQACILLLLREGAGTRSDLARRLRGFDHSDGGAVARALRSLERGGEIRSSREPFSVPSGPWLSYRITDRGVIQLARYARVLRLVHDAMHPPGDAVHPPGEDQLH
jgi:DNA-binding PadR family transcriptional regulator